MKYRVDSVKMTLVEDETLVAGTVGVYFAEFTFDGSWNGYMKTAVFKNGNVTIESVVADNKCEIPWEVLAESGQLYVGIRGENGEKQRPTLWANPKAVFEGAGHGDEPREPTPDIYQQLVGIVSKLRNPVRGEDYYTEADKAEMVSAVIAALPNGDEVSY